MNAVSMRGSLAWASLAIVLLSALPLGSTAPVSLLGFSIAILALFAVGLALDLFGSTPRIEDRSRRAVIVPALLALCVVTWGYVQTSSGLAAGLESWLSRTGWAQDFGSVLHPAWRTVGAEGAISADPIRGRQALLLLLLPVIAFVLGRRIGEDADRGSLAIKACGLWIGGLAAYGLYAYSTGSNFFISDTVRETGGGVTASFVNRNHFATYAAFGAIAALTTILQATPASGSAPSRRRLRDTIEVFMAGGWLQLLALVLCVGAVLVGQSRGGLVALAVGVVVVTLIWILRARRADTRRGVGGAVWLVLAAVVGAAVLGGQGLLGRVVTDETAPLRGPVYAATVEAIGDRPWLGHGLGSFQDVFRAYLPAEAGFGEWDRAHNTYLELAFELGLPAALLLGLVLAIVLIRIGIGALKRRSNANVPLFALGCAAVGLTHSAVDFSLQIPAVGALFSMALGMGWSQSFSRRRKAKRVVKTAPVAIPSADANPAS